MGEAGRSEGGSDGGRSLNIGPDRPGWLVDELAWAGRENLDPEHAARYDGKEDADAAPEVAFLRRRGLDSTSEVVDLGCGTGQFTLAVAPHCRRVVGVDVSPVMLAQLQTRLSAGRFGNVQVVRAGFLTYRHDGAPVDFVYSRYALHHLPDFWKALALQRIRQLLRPGGILRLWDVVYGFDPAEAEERIEAWCATGGTGIEGEWARTELEEHVRDEHSTFTWLLEPMLERTGFRIQEAEYSPDGMFARYVAVVG